jgi:hypothetical protein
LPSPSWRLAGGLAESQRTTALGRVWVALLSPVRKVTEVSPVWVER